MKKYNLNICGHKYSVKFVKDLTDGSGEHHVWGRIHCGRQEIEIEDNQSNSRMSEAITHEVLHAIQSSMHVGLDELGIEILANALHQLGVGNHLLESLQEK